MPNMKHAIFVLFSSLLDPLDPSIVIINKWFQLPMVLESSWVFELSRFSEFLVSFRVKVFGNFCWFKPHEYFLFGIWAYRALKLTITTQISVLVSFFDNFLLGLPHSQRLHHLFQIFRKNFDVGNFVVWATISLLWWNRHEFGMVMTLFNLLLKFLGFLLLEFLLGFFLFILFLLL